jgi:hypothetical protein
MKVGEVQNTLNQKNNLNFFRIIDFAWRFILLITFTNFDAKSTVIKRFWTNFLVQSALNLPYLWQWLVLQEKLRKNVESYDLDGFDNCLTRRGATNIVRICVIGSSDQWWWLLKIQLLSNSHIAIEDLSLRHYPTIDILWIELEGKCSEWNAILGYIWNICSVFYVYFWKCIY